jgi:threonine dehydrogenase-like Zn-dependent dehydrogenase
VKPRGILVLKSTVAADKPINLAPVVIDEITIIGSRCGQFKPAIAYLAKNKLEIKDLISKTFKADDALKAFDYAREKVFSSFDRLFIIISADINF